MKRSLLFFFFLLCSAMLYAETVNVTTPGTLSTQLTAAGINTSTVASLTITGNLNSTDLATLRTMAASNALSIIDLSGATITGNAIPDNAFWGAKLTSIILPNSVISIGNSAFGYCTGLTSFIIPNSVTSIGNSAFQNDKCNISVDPGNTTFSAEDGVLFNADKTSLIFCPISKTGSYIIPNSVTSIGNSAFYYCTGLTSVTIPNSVTFIGNYAFYYCTGLTSVTISNSVTSIGNSTFQNCTGLTSVIIPNSVTSIGNSAFQNCTGLTSVIIPNSATSIGDFAFSSCTGLTSVSIPNSVTSIGNYAFYGNKCDVSVDPGNPSFSAEDGVLFNADKTVLISCLLPKTSYTIPSSVISIGKYAFQSFSSLTSVAIPSSVTSIGDFAFNNCRGLTSVTIPSSVTSIGIAVFQSCSALTSVTIPSSVTSIGNFAFNNCSALTTVTISPSVTSIGSYAFASCSGLTSLTIPSSVTSIGSSAFQSCSGLTSVIIPNSVTSIQNYAFYNCTSLSSVYVYNSTAGNITLGGSSIFTNIKSPATLYVPGGSSYTSTWAGGSWTVTPMAVAPSVGDGSSSKPYQIATLCDLYWLSQTPSAWGNSFIQTADIDATATSGWNGGAGFSPIGTYESAFYGSYDGQGHTISKLYINNIAERNQALFGYAAAGAKFSNIGMMNCSIKGDLLAAALVGYLGSYSVINNCYSTGSISGWSVIGGLVGQMSQATITNCYSSCNVSGSITAGGLAGFNGDNSKISNCYSNGNVSGSSFLGGLVGENYTGSTVTNSYYDTNTSSQSDNDGRGTPKTSAEMKLQNTFTAWDFAGETTNGTADIWAITTDINNGYPCFSWQLTKPTVTTQGATNIGSSTATGNGNISVLESTGYSPTSYGICYSSTNATPTIADNKVDKGTATNTGAFTASLTGLTPNTTYYARAYATNAGGTSYGDVVSFTTSKIQLSLSSITISPKEYDGTTDASSAIKLGTVNGISTAFPNVTVSVGSATYDTKTVGSDKTLSITYTISGTDKDKYIAPIPYKIFNSATIKAKGLTIANATAQNKTYDGNQTATVTGATLNGVVAGDDVTLTLGVASFANANAGNSKTVTVTGSSLSGAEAGNYSLTELSGLTANIIPKTIIVTTDANQTKVYGETDPTISYTFSPALIGSDAFSGNLARTAGENVGNYAFNQGTLSAGSNYSILLVSQDFSITAKAITVTANTGQTKVYGESDPTQTYTVSPALIGSDTFTGNLARTSGENVGNYAIKQGSLSAGSNYTITFVSKDFEITTKAITVTANTAQTKVYGASDPILSYSVSPALIGSDVFTGNLARTAGENVGNYDIAQGSLSAGTNYTLSFVGNVFAITTKAITVTANTGQTKVYGASDPALTYSVSPALIGSDTFTGNLARTSGENVGNYAIKQGSLSAGSNYTITFVSKDFEITTKAITVTANTGQTKVYGASDPILTYSVSPALIGSDVFTGNLARTTGENVGNYAINQGSLSAGSNYTITFVTNDFTITAKAITVTSNAGQTKVYGASDPTLTYTVSPALIGSDVFSGNLARTTGESVGNYAINQGSLSAGSNYTISFVTNDFTITAKAITVTANAGQTKVYGESDPTLTYTVSPALIGSDAFTGNLARTTGESVGNYAINQGTLSAGTNYTISFVSNDFTITAKAITVTANAGQTKVYGASDPTLTYTVSSALIGSDVFSGNLARTAGESVGNYAINQGTLSAGNNYTITFVSKDFAITAKKLTITTPTVVTSKMYDGTTSAVLTALGQVSGIIATDAATVTVSGTASYNDATPGTGKTITVEYALKGNTAGNYLVPASEVIGGAKISVKITLAALKSPQAGCQANDLDLSYSVLTGNPVQYQIVFDEKAIAAGFSNISYTALASSGTDGIITIPVPAGVAEGVYTASLQMINELNEASILYPFTFSINLSSDYIITKFEDVVLCNDVSNRFTAYQWYKNGTVISGASKQFYNDPQGLSGTYSVRVVTTTGDTLMSCSKTIALSSSTKVALTVFPNPAYSNQNCSVKISGLNDDDLQGAVLTVYNLQGQKVYHAVKVEPVNSLNLPVSSGVYVGHVTTAKGTDYTFRIVVAK